MTVHDDLAHAFAGESQANRKYTAFSKQAEKDGFPTVARLFRAAAEAETIHALGHFSAMGGVKTTADNLAAAVGGETEEFTQMYPPMLKQAEEQSHVAARMFRFAMKAEAVHADCYKKALEAVKSGKDLQVEAIYLCPICGNVELVKPTSPCKICGNLPENFVKVS
jgi:rubrerythrin